ncbi:protein ZAR1-like [Erythrolamprus reginae]|uniref:protein ZAR1-like n=1 Tax=Erythrolamprus reginae TaxID=121349 RepID=UPI00396C3F8C
MQGFVYPLYGVYHSYGSSFTPSHDGASTLPSKQKLLSWKQIRCGAISNLYRGAFSAPPVTPSVSSPDYLDTYKRAQLKALHRKANTKEAGVQVNPQTDAAVQCSLGSRPLQAIQPEQECEEKGTSAKKGDGGGEEKAGAEGGLPGPAVGYSAQQQVRKGGEAEGGASGLLRRCAWLEITFRPPSAAWKKLVVSWALGLPSSGSRKPHSLSLSRGTPHEAESLREVVEGYPEAPEVRVGALPKAHTPQRPSPCRGKRKKRE